MRELTFEEMEQVDGGHQTGGLPVSSIVVTPNSASFSNGGIGAAAVGLGGGLASSNWFGTAWLASGWRHPFSSTS